MLSPVSHSNKFQNVRIFCCCYYCSITKLYLTLCDSWTVASQAPLFSTISQNLLKFMNFKSIVLSNHLILCHPLLMPSIFPSTKVFSNELALCIRWPKYSSFRLASVLPKNIQSWSPLGLTCLISLQSKRLSRVFARTTVQKYQFFGAQPSLWSSSHVHTWLWINHSRISKRSGIEALLYHLLAQGYLFSSLNFGFSYL